MIALAPLVIAAASAVAATAPVPVAITDVTVEVADGSTVEHATVVIDGDVITAVGSGVAVPKNAVTIDGKGKVLSPGLFAFGSQLGLFEVGLESGSDDDHLAGSATPGFRTADGFNPLSPRIAVDREEGVTTALLMPSGGKLISGEGFVVELSSRLDGLPDASRPLAMGAAFDGWTAESFGGSRAGLLMALREFLDDARFYQQNAAAFDKGASRTLSLSPVHLRALQPVLKGTLPLVVKVDRASDILALLAFAQEQKIKLVIEGGVESWLVADQLRDAKVPVIVHPSWSGQISLDALHARDDLASVLHKAGVTVVVASWDSANGTTRLRQEAGLAVQNGLPHNVALAAITHGAAAVFGLDQNIVKAGARASLVLWSGDPLEALTIAERVWVNGTLITTPSRQRLLAQKYATKVIPVSRPVAK